MGQLEMSERSREVGRGEAGPRSLEAFAAYEGAMLQRALIGRFGTVTGSEVCQDALAYAADNWPRVSAMVNPVGYLFRVGCGKARKYRRWSERMAGNSESVEVVESPAVDVDLIVALGKLRFEQRVSLLMVHAFGYTYEEVGAVLGCSSAAVGNHVRRGLAKLRRDNGLRQG